MFHSSLHTLSYNQLNPKTPKPQNPIKHLLPVIFVFEFICENNVSYNKMMSCFKKEQDFTLEIPCIGQIDDDSK